MENSSTSTETERNDATTTEDQIEYDVGRPFVLEVKYDDGTQKEYELMMIDEDDRHKPRFSLPHGLDLSARTLLELYLSDSFLYDVVKYTNKYGRYRAPQTFKNVTIGEIYVFFSIILYMGVVQVPSKEDYWKGGTIWPSHTPCQRMKEYCFHQIWRHIHLTPITQGDLFGDEVDEENPPIDARWYAKAAPFIDQANRISQKLCKFPGFCVSVDEMMRLLKGRSVQSFHMKQKPIKEGYKFWSICCAQSGFCWKIIPAACVGNEEGRQIIESMLSLIESLPLRDTKKYVYFERCL